MRSDKKRLPGNPFTRPAMWLVKRFRPDSPSGRNMALNENIRLLSGGRKDAAFLYHTKKTANVLLLSCLLLPAAITAVIAFRDKTSPVPEGRILRGDYGEAERKEELIARVEGETEDRPVTVSIKARLYTAREQKELLERAEEYIEKNILSDNATEDEVRSSLFFPSSVMDGAVKAEWMTMPYGIISENGQITGMPGEEGTLVEIRATLTCQEETLIYQKGVMVFPPLKSPGEQLANDLEAAVAEADAAGSTDKYLVLPEKVGQRQVRWFTGSASYGGALLLLSLVILLFYWIYSDRYIQELAEKRSRQLALDYGDLAWKLTMLIGAGQTVTGSFYRITRSYRRYNKGKKRYVYEEMLYACREMQGGVPQGLALENFGRRCGLGNYIKLGALLAQYMKKGSRGLKELLEKEAQRAMEDRKSAARKLGEKAGTKLLFPMILMLGVVLMILMVPAVMTF